MKKELAMKIINVNEGAVKNAAVINLVKELTKDYEELFLDVDSQCNTIQISMEADNLEIKTYTDDKQNEHCLEELYKSSAISIDGAAIQIEEILKKKKVLPKKQKVLLSLDIELLNKIDEIKKRTGRSRNEIANEALKRVIDFL